MIMSSLFQTLYNKILGVPSNSAAQSAKGRRTFHLVAQTQQEEDAFDYVKLRTDVKYTGVVGSIAHLVKGALGAGILGSHVAYMKAGVYVAIPLQLIFALYIGYCLHLLVKSAQILYRRTMIPSMSYPDVGEAAMSCFPNPKVARFSKSFRYLIDSLITIDLFGACACYQIIIAKSIKQLVENTHATSLQGLPGYPELRIYLLAMIIPLICICLIQHLKWLAPFSIVANIIILFCISMAVYYAILLNPTFSNMKTVGKLSSVFEFTGLIVFSMSCAGMVLPVENNMKNPKWFPITLAIGMILIMMCTFMIAFFGYVGFLDECESPITVNFPMTTVPKILKGLIAVMIFVTHALNFWVPFNLCFHYIKQCHNQNRLLMWEMFYRALFVLLIGLVAIAFPNVNALMGFIGTLCLSNMAFIWPPVINLLVIWHRPGLGKFKWRLWRNLTLFTFGIFILVCGSYVNGRVMVSVLLNKT